MKPSATLVQTFKRPYGTVRRALDAVGAQPAVVLNGVPHYVEAAVERAGEQIAEATSQEGGDVSGYPAYPYPAAVGVLPRHDFRQGTAPGTSNSKVELVSRMKNASPKPNALPATDWTAGLRSLDLDGIRPVFDELAGHENDAARGWVGDRKAIRRTDRRVLLDARRLKDAVKHIGRLPAPGEAYHLVTAKRYSLWNVVQAVLQLAAPATIAYFGVATLGFSKQNLEELLALLDRGQIAKVDFLFSVYFKSNEKEICQRLAHELTTRGHRVVAMLTHAKIMLLELSDGPRYVVESSANLRSCASIENIMLANDTELFDFHRQWLTEVLEAKK